MHKNSHEVAQDIIYWELRGAGVLGNVCWHLMNSGAVEFWILLSWLGLWLAWDFVSALTGSQGGNFAYFLTGRCGLFFGLQISKCLICFGLGYD